MKIAYFSPLPFERSGIANYSAMLLPALSKFADLTLYTNSPESVVQSLTTQFPIKAITDFTGPISAGVDICLYQMGNNTQYHQDIYHMMRRYPGVVTLHDINLHSFYGDLYLTTGLIPDYCREMAFSYGGEGVEHARGSLRGKHPYDTQRYPLFDRIVNSNLGIVVHSHFAAAQIQEKCPQATVQVIPHLQTLPKPEDQASSAEAKIHLGFKSDTILLASFGFVSPSKRINETLRAFANLRHRFPQIRLALVGQVVEGYNLDSLLDKLNLNKDDVRLVGYADQETFQQYLAATDIGINLRYPTIGETSGTLLHLLSWGKPVLVSNVDSFADFPETVVVKIDIGDDEQSQIETQLTTLITDETIRQEIGNNAAQLVREQHAPEVVAQRYIEFLQEVVGVV